MKKIDPSEFFEITDDKGNNVEPKKLFLEVEKLFSNNFDKYSKNIIPLSLAYCGLESPFEALMFSIGILTGCIVERKKMKIKFKGSDMVVPPAMLKMLYDLRKNIND